MIKIGKLYINVFIFPLIVATYLTNSLFELTLAYITATIHEFAHFVVAQRYNVKVSSFVIMPFGVYIRLKDKQIDNPIEECVICAAGPIINLIIIIIGFAIRHYMELNTTLLDFFICSNASMLLINTVAVVPLDGGRILRAMLTAKYGFAHAVKITNVISHINIILIGMFGIYILYITHFNVSVMLLCTFLIFNMSNEKRNNELMIMRQIVSSKEKLARREIMPVRELAAVDNVLIRKLLKSFSYDCYYIVNVMNSKMEIRASLTETQIIKALSESLTCAKLSDVLDKFSQRVL